MDPKQTITISELTIQIALIALAEAVEQFKISATEAEERGNADMKTVATIAAKVMSDAETELKEAFANAKEVSS